ncbi:hypothetical protein QBC43DRAFT_223434 [Cladorrhinum sp. PSN259]|nr:hypothetical protein QBC43DRAFT_223434 [Cladorrhinum sp. PSN259]
MEAVVYTTNLLPHRTNPNDLSPHEILTTGLNMPEISGEPPFRHLRTHFSHAYYYVKPKKRDKSNKQAKHAEKGRLLGYADIYGRIYWVWNPSTK